MCKCGNKAITPDKLCKSCFFIREAWQHELKVRRRYDRRMKKQDTISRLERIANTAETQRDALNQVINRFLSSNDAPAATDEDLTFAANALASLAYSAEVCAAQLQTFRDAKAEEELTAFLRA